jgi:hypothetical protein
VKLQPFLLVALASMPALAQSTLSGADPYAPRTHGYTSRDNPYAPGGIYDPYRGSRPTGSASVSDDNDVGGVDSDAEPTPCTDKHLASDVSADLRTSGNRLGFGNGTKSIGSLNRPSTTGYGAVSHCRKAGSAIGSDHSISKPGLGMNDALSGNLPKH